jgi:hypothetical protein
MAQFKRLLLTFGIILLASVAHAQNSVYIDQIGNNSTIDVTQTGIDNVLGNNTNKAVFYGDSQGVTISQIGSYNTSVMNVQGNGTTLSSLVTGDSNQVNVSCGNTGPLCNQSAITASATGDQNTINITGGAKSTLGASVTGSNNTVNVTSTTTNLNGATATVTQTGGDTNNITVTQNGPAGLNGFQARVDVTGGGNVIGVTQGGTVDSTVNIKSAGSNNNITVHSGN